MTRALAIAATVLALAGCSTSSTPQACLDALDAADALNATVAEYMQHAQAGTTAGADALRAASTQDAAAIAATTAAIEEAGQRILEIAPDLREFRNDYEAAAKKCRKG